MNLTNCTTISPRELNERLEGGEHIDLIDVRTPIEFREVHIVFAKNRPLDRLNPAEICDERRQSTSPLYVVCRSGGRAVQAIEKLFAAGVKNLVNVEGGTQAWESEGLPVQRGKKAMSLERQVRIAAGAMVFIGAALSYFMDIRWAGLPAFVGAGLMFAGITDTCTMGMMIAKMPWNQIKSCGTS